jgi:hypothetical protein
LKSDDYGFRENGWWSVPWIRNGCITLSFLVRGGKESEATSNNKKTTIHTLNHPNQSAKNSGRYQGSLGCTIFFMLHTHRVPMRPDAFHHRMLRRNTIQNIRIMGLTPATVSGGIVSESLRVARLGHARHLINGVVTVGFHIFKSH